MLFTFLTYFEDIYHTIAIKIQVADNANSNIVVGYTFICFYND